MPNLVNNSTSFTLFIFAKNQGKKNIEEEEPMFIVTGKVDKGYVGREVGG